MTDGPLESCWSVVFLVFLVQISDGPNWSVGQFVRSKRAVCGSHMDNLCEVGWGADLLMVLLANMDSLSLIHGRSDWWPWTVCPCQTDEQSFPSIAEQRKSQALVLFFRFRMG